MASIIDADSEQRKQIEEKYMPKTSIQTWRCDKCYYPCTLTIEYETDGEIDTSNRLIDTTMCVFVPELNRGNWVKK